LPLHEACINQIRLHPTETLSKKPTFRPAKHAVWSLSQIWHFLQVVRVPTKKYLNAKSIPEEFAVDVRNLDFSRPLGGALDLGDGEKVEGSQHMRAILYSVHFQVPPGTKVRPLDLGDGGGDSIEGSQHMRAILYSVHFQVPPGTKVRPRERRSGGSA
jgi:hypothetical protein